MTATPLRAADFPVTRSYRYFNHAGVCALPTVAVEAMAECLASVCDRGSLAGTEHEERIEEVRAAGARLMGVPVDDVAFVKNTTEGLGFVASGLRYEPGDRVVVPACEFPSNLSPWAALDDLGVQVVQVAPEGPGDRLPVDAFEAVLAQGGVRVVAVSWVQFGRGWQVDLPALGALCRRHGALFCVDAIQGLGVLPARFEEWGVDFASADAHKWMVGPEGIGLFYARAGSRDQLRVLEPGWNAVAHRGAYDDRRWIPDGCARRFEGGTYNVAGIVGLGASLDLLLDAGIDAVWEHVDGLCTRLAEGLAAAGCEVLSERGAGRSGIVTFRVGETDPVECCERLLAEGFVTSPRGFGVRVSPHGYNTEDEIDALAAAVRDLEQVTAG